MTLLFFLSVLLPVLDSGPAQTLPSGLSGKADTLKVWQVSAERISADPLGNFYIVSSGSLVRFDPEGDSAYSWSDPASGRITLADSGDPLRTLIYHKDFNMIRFLNNRLAPLSEPVRLDDLGITSPLAIAISRQGGFWVLDGSTYRIRYIDRQLKIVVESEPLNLLSGSGTPDYRLIESGDQVFLLLPGREIQVFDLFANFVKKIPVKASSFSCYGQLILLVFPDKILLRSDPVTPDVTVFLSGGADILEACMTQDKLLVRTSTRVILFRR